MDNKVLDEAVEVALAAYVSSRGSYEGEVPASPDDIRAALLASLPVLLGPVVEAWREMAPPSDPMIQSADDCADDLESIYAPSLGEGE